MSYTLNEDDLAEHLRRQIRLLTKSADDYDAGDADEAVRMAVALRILLHDTRHSHSILGQLRLLETLSFVDTAEPFNPGNLLASNCLVMFRFEGGSATYAPLLSTGPYPTNEKPFPDWWLQVIAADTNRNQFTRRDFVSSVADQDGGAHVDSELGADYADVSRNNSLGWIQETHDTGTSITPSIGLIRFGAWLPGAEPPGTAPMGGPVPASIRQIAHEVLRTTADLPQLSA